QTATYLRTGTPLHHLKLHGALYHLSETDPAIRAALLTFLQNTPTTLICLAGGQVAQAATHLKLPILQEAFLDRHYQPDGQLLPRTHPEALIHHLPTLTERLRAWQHAQPIPAIDGTPLHLHPDTLCVHSDSPDAPTLLRHATQLLA
ncbi:MAG: LamB/YcsF family protein, partial [Verrucomicrobiales bacterium]